MESSSVARSGNRGPKGGKVRKDRKVTFQKSRLKPRKVRKVYFKIASQKLKKLQKFKLLKMTAISRPQKLRKFRKFEKFQLPNLTRILRAQKLKKFQKFEKFQLPKMTPISRHQKLSKFRKHGSIFSSGVGRIAFFFFLNDTGLSRTQPQKSQKANQSVHLCVSYSCRRRHVKIQDRHVGT